MTFANRMMHAACVCSFVVVGCSESNPVKPIEDHDVITTLELNFVSPTSDTLRFIWQDKDGEGGASPDRIDTIRLQHDVVYQGFVRVYNATVTPRADLTPTIVSESDHHQFIFVAPHGGIVVTAIDKDANNKPIGIQFEAITSNPTTSTLSVNLYHYLQPSDKVGGTPGSESDIGVVYPLLVE